VERVRVGSDLGSHIDRWKQMRRDGWELEVLLAPDRRSAVCVGFRDEQVPLFEKEN